MAKVRQRTWRVPGQRTKRKAWGFVTVENGKHRKKCSNASCRGCWQVRQFDSEWTKEDAENALAARLLKIEQEPKAKEVPGLTLAQAAEKYLGVKARKRSIYNDRRILEHLKSAFGAETPLAEITASRIADYKAARLGSVRKISGTERPIAAATLNRALALLRHLLRLAHEEWEIIETVPRIRLEKEPEGRIRWLGQYAPDEEARLLAACEKSRNHDLAKIVTLALETGLRRGELLGLAWDRIDLSRGVIRLEMTKAGRRREVPMRQVVYDILAALPGPREGRVFKTRSVRTAFENAVAEAKLDDFHFHDLRHHFASWFVMRGGSLQALQKILGHATLAMTQRYAHLSPDFLRSEVAKTERAERRTENAEKITQEITQEPAEPVGVSQNPL